MSFGFNSKVQTGEYAYHVQTEHRGPPHPVIETVVVLAGRVLYRRNSSYADLIAEGDADAAALGGRVEQQHRETVEALRAGTLPLEKTHRTQPGSDTGIQVKLCNPDSWLLGEQAALEVEVARRAGGEPIAGADITVRVESRTGQELGAYAAQTNQRGRAWARFAFPAPAEAAVAVLVIEARSLQERDVLRYHVKRKSRRPSSPAP